MNLSGNNIITLIGLKESDDSVLQFLEALGVERPEIDKYGSSEGIDLEDELGIELGFSSKCFTAKQKADKSGGLYLNLIEFLYTFDSLPFGINGSDSFLEVKNKIGSSIIYKSTDNDDKNSRYWLNKDKGYWLSVLFEDESLEEVYGITICSYESPTQIGLVLLE